VQGMAHAAVGGTRVPILRRAHMPLLYTSPNLTFRTRGSLRALGICSTAPNPEDSRTQLQADLQDGHNQMTWQPSMLPPKRIPVPIVD
jgi:hypothetical protein